MGYFSCSAESSISTSTPLPPSSSSFNNIHHFPYSDLVAATNDFSPHNLLGKGTHSHVYKATLRGLPVAIKKPTSPEIANEIDVLSKIHSPHLVNLLGFATDSSPKSEHTLLLVVEFMTNGSLYDLLHSNSDSNPKFLNWGRRIRLALQIAKAIHTLHASTPPIIHRDIKSSNILIDSNFSARLGDFGLAIRAYDSSSFGKLSFKFRSIPPAGTMGYHDPHYVTPECLSTKNDVFSFGVLLLEIMSGRKAIDVTHSPSSILDWAIPLIKRRKVLGVYDPRIGPPKDLVVRKQLGVIAAKCVRSCGERRPEMKDVVGWLSGLCKLEALHYHHSWNHYYGFNFNINVSNPCMMVETYVGKFDGGLMRDSRRVFSDVGFSSNLMELMEKEREVVKVCGGSRFGSGRYFLRRR